MPLTLNVNPVKPGIRARKFQGMSGATGLTGFLRAYSAGKLDGRHPTTKWIRALERRLIHHCGYDESTAPITVKGKAHIICRLHIFLAMYEPQDQNDPGAYAPIRSAETLLSKLYTELGLQPPEKPAISLQDYLSHETGKERA